MFSKNFIMIRIQINKQKVAGLREHQLGSSVLGSTVEHSHDPSRCSEAQWDHSVHTVHIHMSYHMYDLNININLYIISNIYKYIIDI